MNGGIRCCWWIACPRCRIFIFIGITGGLEWEIEMMMMRHYQWEIIPE